MTSFIFVMFGININLLVALSANRYWAVCHPTSYFTSKENGYQKWIIFTSVFIGTILGILPAIGWNSGYFDGACYLVDLVSFSYLFLCCSWTLASSVVIIILYGLIYKSLAKHVSLWRPSSKPNIFKHLLSIVVKDARGFVRWQRTWDPAEREPRWRNQNHQNHVASRRKFSSLLDARHTLLSCYRHQRVAVPIWLKKHVIGSNFSRCVNHLHTHELSYWSAYLCLSNKRSPWRH